MSDFGAHFQQDHEMRKFCTIHLGDGTIRQKNHEREIRSYPMNGWNSNQTYLTISQNALQKMKISWGDMKDTAGYAMATDGMYDYPMQIRKLISLMKNGGRDVPTKDDRELLCL